MNDCIFCKIVAGEIPAEKVYEDENTIAFLDITPVNPGHVLVIPKTHHKNMFDTPNEVLYNLIDTTKKIAAALKEDGEEGVNVISNNEPAAGQVVFHTHFHIVPRNSNDGIKLLHGKEYGEGEMQKTGEKIRNALKNSA